jgi:hypothetical protein
MRPEPLALTLDQTEFRTAAWLYATADWRARLAQLRDYLGLPVAVYATRPWSEEGDQ